MPKRSDALFEPANKINELAFFSIKNEPDCKKIRHRFSPSWSEVVLPLH